MVAGRIRKHLKQLIEERARELGCETITLETMPDRVHLLLQAPPTIAPNRIVAGIKVQASRILRREFSELSEEQKW